MKLYILNIIILIFPKAIQSKSEYEAPTLINEMDNSNLDSSNEMAKMCIENCFDFMKPVLEKAVTLQDTEEQVQKKLADAQEMIRIYEETIRNQDFQLNQLNLQMLTAEMYKSESTDKLRDHEELIKNKDLTLAKHLLSFEKYKNETMDKLRDNEETIKNKDLTLAEHLITFEKYKNEAINKHRDHEEIIKNKDLTLDEHLLSFEKYKNETIDKHRAHEEIIKNKDQALDEHLQTFENYKNETMNKLRGHEETINNKELQLNELIAASEKIKNEILYKLTTCEETFDKLKSAFKIPSSCIGKSTGIHDVIVPGMPAFSVPCDSSLAGSGWTVIQRRMDGSVDFNRNWDEYREGFGDPSGEFFIGLEKLHLLTKSQPHELYIHLMDFNNEIRYAKYSEFAIGSEEEFYILNTLGSYSGNADDSLRSHKNVFFSTPDKNHDTDERNCAQDYSSGWWFNNCYTCNLNGIYLQEESECYYCIKWKSWKEFQPLKFTQMMIKPKCLLLAG